MKTTPRHHRRLRGGFTLVELVLAMLIVGFLMTSIFRLADATLASTRAMVDHQTEEITNDAFFTLMKNHFEGLPGNCVMELVATSETKPYLSEMTFQNAPTGFNWGGLSVSAQALRIITKPGLDGLSIVLEYYNEPILDSDETVAERGIEPIASVTLLEGVSDFEWYVFDGRRDLDLPDNEWPHEWVTKNRRPTFVRLSVRFGRNDEPIERVFWIPNKVNPVTQMRQLQNAARNGAQQNSGAPTGNPIRTP